MAAPMDVNEACCVLGIHPTTFATMSQDQIRALYRQRVLATHPDKGGSKDEFTRCYEAFRALKAAAKSTSQTRATPSTPPTTPCGGVFSSDLLCRAFAGEDVEAELVARGVYRPPATFGCPPFTQKWEEGRRAPRAYQYTSSSDDEQ